MRLYKALSVILFAVCLCSCINSSNQASYKDENESLLITDFWDNFSPQTLSKENQKKFIDITRAFYEQSFQLKEVSDDSSFCGYYSPRKITIDSIMPFYDCGQYNGAYILTFIVNGFFYKYNEFEIIFNEDYSSFVFLGEKNNHLSDFLIPQVYKNGQIINIKDAYKQGIVKKDFFEGESLTYKVETKGNNAILSNIDRSYFANLPSLVNNQESLFSVLDHGFEQTKRTFYEKEILSKGYKNDMPFRQLFFEERYRNYYIEVDYSSIHLNFYKQLSSSVIYLLSINDILFDIQAWFNEPQVHEFKLGKTTFCSQFVIEPIIEVNDDVYFVSEAFEKGALSQAEMDEISQAFSSNVLLSEQPDGYVALETKLLERHYTLNKIHSAL